MNKDDLEKLAKDSKYIPGIYNYCDRWCERCPFTSRCLNCTLVNEQFGDLENIDELNEAFWEKFSEMLHGTLAMIRDIAKEQGIDLDAMDAENDHGHDDVHKEKPLAHLISHASEGYAKSVDRWFDSNEYLFLEKEEEMNRIRIISQQSNPLQNSQDIQDINDAVEIIRWYQWQIHVKLKRAIDGASMRESIDLDEFPKDSDGSAKVALIGIDRSLSAWKVLLTVFPGQKKQILDFITKLEHIKNRVENQFPDARNFIRPGFDENKEKDDAKPTENRSF
jgi:hypothetical protein